TTTRFVVGTIFEGTKLRLVTRLRAAYLVHVQYIRATDLARALPVNYKTALLLMNKFRAAVGPHARFQKAESLSVELAPHRPSELPHPHGCERLERPDLAERTDDEWSGEGYYPWKRWIRERGPLPSESRFADEA